jgi:hypothetical protein
MIVKVEIKDNDLFGMSDYPNGVLDTYYLVDPDKNKLAVLKHMIEHRFDYMSAENLTDEEFEKAEELHSNIWDAIDLFISANFTVLDIDEVYEIAY